jgi:hypothetical protein
MVTLEILQPGSSPTHTEVAKYVGEMAAQLANMARGLGASELAAMLEMARTEAEQVVQTWEQRRADGVAAPSRH